MIANKDVLQEGAEEAEGSSSHPEGGLPTEGSGLHYLHNLKT
jgi:hypothetical protein